MSSAEAGSKQEAKHMSKPDPTERGVILISYPKIVFLWPTWLVAIAAGIVMRMTGDTLSTWSTFVAWAFLITLSINLVVLSFDFPRATSLILFFVIATVILGAILATTKFPDFLPSINRAIHSLTPAANATFYTIFVAVLALIFLGVWINTRFDFWEVRPNELLHHHGMLSDLERFPSPHLRIEKEINDVFEYMLLGSGRLILQPSSERKAIVLDNVFWISSKEKEITKLLGALQVQVRESTPS